MGNYSGSSNRICNERWIRCFADFLDNGGRVLIDVISLTKDEYEQSHFVNLQSSNGSLVNVSSLSEFKSMAINIVENAGLLLEILITETNNNGAKVCTWRSIIKIVLETMCYP